MEEEEEEEEVLGEAEEEERGTEAERCVRNVRSWNKW